MDILQESSGILFIGNGDNILNYPRAAMAGKILQARKERRPLATVAAYSPALGAEKIGFAAQVTYRNKKTGQVIKTKAMRDFQPQRNRTAFTA